MRIKFLIANDGGRFSVQKGKITAIRKTYDGVNKTLWFQVWNGRKLISEINSIYIAVVMYF